MKFLYCKFLIFCMVLSDQRTPYSIMYVWAAFEAKSPPTRQDLVTLIPNSSLESKCLVPKVPPPLFYLNHQLIRVLKPAMFCQ